jgi:glycosyltransferase involved in cell wall biosynthesis
MRKGITMLTTYPTQACGIATFSQDLVTALSDQFGDSMGVTVAVIENGEQIKQFPSEVKFRFDPADAGSAINLANELNEDPDVSIITVQHEFGLFYRNEENFMQFLTLLQKPVVVVFHTVLPQPDPEIRSQVEAIAARVSSIVVMTENAKGILAEDYDVDESRICVIPHGTHLVADKDPEELKKKYGYEGRQILSTFGLMSSGKNLETTIRALPEIIRENPNVLFLAIGKTHPNVVKHEGEVYREMLEKLVDELGIRRNVEFVNRYTTLPELLEFLQMTDIYLFTSKDPNQAVSGTLSYALSCGCPIISTPIPHAKELVRENNGLLVPFSDEKALAQAVNRLLGDDELRSCFSLNSLHYMAPTSWENVANSFIALYQQLTPEMSNVHYTIPQIDLSHVKALTTKTGMYQFSKLGIPDPESGYTLDDNARALIAVTESYALTKNDQELSLMKTYLGFIEFCQHPTGYFMNYVDERRQFTDQNYATNLSDSNGRAIWALGHLIAHKEILPEEMVIKAEKVLRNGLHRISGIHSPRAIGFTIKGLRCYHATAPSFDTISLIIMLADRLVQFYRHESGQDWKWFESYLTYANSVLPEALLYAYEVTGNGVYRDIARESFDFLLSHTYTSSGLRVISNNGWMQKGSDRELFGEQPIDVAYTIMALDRFYKVFGDREYLLRLEASFNWFLGQNHLRRMIYNKYTGGCWDGLEKEHVNLNQGAESTVSYLLARLAVESNMEDLMKLRRNDEENIFLAEMPNGGNESDRRKVLETEIARLTREMEKFPEVYLRLSETPLFIANHDEENSLANTEKYLSFLYEQLGDQGTDLIGKVS